VAENSTKENIRKKVRGKLKQLSGKEISEKSRLIIKALLAYERWQKANVVMCYVSTGLEVETQELIAEALKSNKKIVIPRCDLNIEKMTPYLIENLKTDLQKGAYGILEPCEKVKPYEGGIDLCILPGVAFDRKGHRLGRGKGYFDKFLSRPEYSRAYKIALSFEVQLVRKLEVRDHDVIMDRIITEKNIY